MSCSLDRHLLQFNAPPQRSRQHLYLLALINDVQLEGTPPSSIRARGFWRSSHSAAGEKPTTAESGGFRSLRVRGRRNQQCRHRRHCQYCEAIVDFAQAVARRITAVPNGVRARYGRADSASVRLSSRIAAAASLSPRFQRRRDAQRSPCSQGLRTLHSAPAVRGS